MIQLSAHIPVNQINWRNDPQLYRWTRQNGPITYFEHQNWVRSLEGNSSVRMFGIEAEASETSVTGMPIKTLKEVGTCGLTSINLTHRTAEFSLFIAPEEQGKGYGRAALKELLNLGFGAMNLYTIYGETFTGNPALKLFLDLGMQEEGILRKRYEKDNQRFDAIMVSITRDEWYGRSA